MTRKEWEDELCKLFADWLIMEEEEKTQRDRIAGPPTEEEVEEFERIMDELDRARIKEDPMDDNLKDVKEDSGKPQLSLVPIQGMWEAIARIREYGDKKYPDKDNWKKVDRDRWWNAYLRHTAACANDPQAVDIESGLPHAWHAACNLMFCLELDRLGGDHA